MQFRDFFVRAFAILLIGSLTCAPFAVSAGGMAPVADAQVMPSDMAMDSAAAAPDEMPCHQNGADKGKNCPFMAICVMLCCPGLAVSQAPLAIPAPLVSRMVPPEFVQLDGVNSPPPSRPPKA